MTEHLVAQNKARVALPPKPGTPRIIWEPSNACGPTEDIAQCRHYREFHTLPQMFGMRHRAAIVGSGHEAALLLDSHFFGPAL